MSVRSKIEKSKEFNRRVPWLCFKGSARRLCWEENGRMYDPILGRMLSPDNYVQAPYNTQSHNRYTYCLNNPLKYTDPSGNKWGFWAAVAEVLTGGAVSATAAVIAGTAAVTASAIAGVATTNAIQAFGTGLPNGGFTEGNRRAINSWRISGGGLSGNFDQILSRWTWEMPQTLVGQAYGQFANNLGRVQSVGYFDGATVVNVTDLPLDGDQGAGVTFGSFIYGQGISTNPFETDASGRLTQGAMLLRHEYGHYIQSQSNGWMYLSKFGISSAIGGGGNWTESDAEFRSDQYFNSSVFFSYLPGYRPINARWSEYSFIFGGGYLFGGTLIGLLN